ncbi:MAG: hypothetical protein CVT63_00665 [Candidatus Anoxymicrobium japonicum]|uniref:DUF6311 domain-containing protein n=1 Tax=Candidatus Anoxymicrobium japonicum TaxID=2013648 RepID=A0A2N3G7X1_9ACTN|nr:MAG: hypothetical protein CVT63_00665 [Candidatus Anoxymicrobium japonicum]
MPDPKIINQSRAMGLAIIIVFLVLSCVFTRPMISKGNHATYKDPYDPTFEAWTLAWDVKTLTSNPFNLFNSNIYFPNPHTLSYSDYQFTTAFIGAPLMLLTGNPVETANLMLIFNLFLCALGAYLLAKHLTGNRIGAFVAGVVFAFAAPRMAHMGHLQLSTAGWIPLCLLFLHKYSEEGKWKDAAMAALFFVLQTLATWYYGIMLSVAIMLFLLVRLMLNRKGFTLRWTLILLIAFALAGCVIAPFARPYLEVQSKNPRFVRTIEEVDIFSADVRDFAIASEENMVWGKLTAGLRESTVKRGGPTERSLFPGLLPLVLGIAGACVLFAKGRARERFYARFYIALAALAVVLCLGSRLYFFGHTADIPMPYDLFYYFFPGFKVIRVPPRFIILILLSLAVLSAFAVRFFLSWLGRRRSPALGALAALAIVGLLFLDLMSVSLPMYTIPLKNEFPPVYAWLKQQPGDAPTAELPLADYVPRTFKDGLQYEETWLAREPWRVYYSTLHWKKLLNGYSGFIPDSYYESVKALAGFPSKESVAYLKALGIEYVIVHANLFNPVTLQKVFAWSLKHHGLQPWKVFDANRDDIDYVYRLR